MYGTPACYSPGRAYDGYLRVDSTGWRAPARDEFLLGNAGVGGMESRSWNLIAAFAFQTRLSHKTSPPLATPQRDGDGETSRPSSGLPGCLGCWRTLQKSLPRVAVAVRTLDVHFVSPVPVECHARAGGHPVPMALGPWIPAFAGMTRGHKHWQCMYEMDI